MDTPLSPRHTLGRIYGTDWTIANVAKLLRFNAGQGVARTGPLTGGRREVNEKYLRTTTARHLPTSVCVALRRDETENWYAELCFADLERYLPWNDAVAEQWLAALFLGDRPFVSESTGTPRVDSARRFSVTAMPRTAV